MRVWIHLGLAALCLSLVAPHGARAAPGDALAEARKALRSDAVTTLEYVGSGTWNLFGQSPSPSAPDPEFEMTSYTADINYVTGAKHVVIIRNPALITRVLLAQAHQVRADDYVQGDVSWIIGPPGGPGTGLAPANIPEQKNAEERYMEIWATPHGFLRAAAAHQAVSRAVKGGTEVTFRDGPHKFVGLINAQHEVARIRTWIDSPVLGDMPCDAIFTDYRDFDGWRFPGHIVRTMGGKTRLDMKVTSVKVNLPVDIVTPEPMRIAMTEPVRTSSDVLAPGVYWIRGFQWHSVVIDQGDHIVVVDAPLDEARSNAVIAKAKELIPNKPIRYLVNTHAHFDHAGGVRTYVDEGATIVTMPVNQAYYERIWKTPHTIRPDRLQMSGKTPKFLPITDGKVVLDDPVRPVEVYHQQGTGHNVAMAIAYLPKEKILIEADGWNTEAISAPKPQLANPYVVNLNDNIQRLHLDVAQIVPLHGPRTGTMPELIELTNLPRGAP